MRKIDPSRIKNTTHNKRECRNVVEKLVRKANFDRREVFFI